MVLWGNNLGSTVGYGIFTKEVRNMIKIPPFQYSIIIGLILSDGLLTIASKTSNNARLWFKQSLSHSLYVCFVFNEGRGSPVPIARLPLPPCPITAVVPIN